MTNHANNYHSQCQTPKNSWRWKMGQVWLCDCGNIFQRHNHYLGKGWYKMGTIPKDQMTSWAKMRLYK